MIKIFGKRKQLEKRLEKLENLTIDLIVEKRTLVTEIDSLKAEIEILKGEKSNVDELNKKINALTENYQEVIKGINKIFGLEKDDDDAKKDQKKISEKIAQVYSWK